MEMALPAAPAPVAATASVRPISFRVNDPYRASVLPMLPQPPTQANPHQPGSGRGGLPPVHHHSSYHHLPRVGFAMRKKGDVARAIDFDEDDASALNINSNNTEPRLFHQQRFAFVRFKHETCCYRLSFSLRSGDYVVVEADRGFNVGMVERVTAEAPIYRVLSNATRVATAEEAMALTALRLEERQVIDYVQGAADACHIPLHVVDVEFQFDRNKLTIYFQSEVVVDFRRLQRALFKQFGCRIWLVMWQDVPRDRR